MTNTPIRVTITIEGSGQDFLVRETTETGYALAALLPAFSAAYQRCIRMDGELRDLGANVAAVVDALGVTRAGEKTGG